MLRIIAVCVCENITLLSKATKRNFNEKHKHEQNVDFTERKRNKLKRLYCLVLMTDLTNMNSFLIKTPSRDDEYTIKCFKLSECFSVKQEKYQLLIKSYNFLTFTNSSSGHRQEKAKLEFCKDKLKIKVTGHRQA